MSPKVSVIIPTYNRAGLVAEAISSVINQTFQDFEIIVADSSSTDNTKEIVLSFGPKVKYLNGKHTGMPASGRNLGLRNASGEYIAFLDSDDIWLPEKLELQLSYFKLNPRYKAVYSNTYIVDAKRNPTGKLLIGSGHAKEGRIFKGLLKENFIPVHTVIMKREVFEKIGYFNEDRAEDYDYWLRVSLEFDIGYINKPLAMYRVHTGGLSSEDKSEAVSRQKVLRRLLCDRCKFKNDITDQIYRLYFSTALNYWRKSDRLNAKNDIKKYIIYQMARLRILNVLLGLLMYFIVNFKYNKFAGLVRISESIMLKLI